MKTVVAVADGSVESQVALEWCASHLDDDAEVVAVYGRNPVGGFVLGLPLFDPATEHEIVDLLETSWTRPLHEAHLAHRCVVVAQSPVNALRAVAQQEHAEMIVVGRHPHGTIHDLVAGDLATHLVHRSPCPVLVVPAAPDHVAAGHPPAPHRFTVRHDAD